MYFDRFKTTDEIKERYRQLAKLLHPDVGGDKAIMAEVNEEYKLALVKKPDRKVSDFFENENQLKINAILEWAEKNDFFDTKFVEDLDMKLLSGRSLSVTQERALDNIIRKFRIPYESM